MESDFQLKLRLDKVDCIQKMSLFNRQELLERIMNDYDRTRNLLKERQDLQTQRKMANMNASMQRQMMSRVRAWLCFEVLTLFERFCSWFLDSLHWQ